MATNGLLLACIESTDKSLVDVTHLLLVNRAFAGHDFFYEDVMFVT